MRKRVNVGAHRHVNLDEGAPGMLVRGLSVAKQCLSETATISLIAHSNAK